MIDVIDEQNCGIFWVFAVTAFMYSFAINHGGEAYKNTLNLSKLLLSSWIPGSDCNGIFIDSAMQVLINSDVMPI